MSYTIFEIQNSDEILELSKIGHEYHQNKYPEIFKDFNSAIAKNDIEKILSENKNSSFLAKIENNNAGYILCRVRDIPENEYRYGYSVLFIDQLAVKPEYRNKGVAQKLIDRAIERAKELKIDKIELNCWVENIEAMKLYKKNKFKEIRVSFERKISI